MRTAALVAATATWAAWLLVTPTLAIGAAPRIAAAAYRLGGLVCHQQSKRSLHVGAVQLPVCARCTGLYVGAVVGSGLALGWVMAGRLRRRRCSLGLPAIRRALVASAMPTALLWVTEYGASVAVPGWARALGAVPLGAAVAWLAGVVVGGVRVTNSGRTSGIN